MARARILETQGLPLSYAQWQTRAQEGVQEIRKGLQNTPAATALQARFLLPHGLPSTTGCCHSGPQHDYRRPPKKVTEIYRGEGQSDGTKGRVLALQATDTGSIPGSPHGNPEQHWLWPRIRKKILSIQENI